MSYESALEAAGAKVIAFRQFGSYQGDWWAKVEHDGEVGFIKGSYGSCSGCDAFQAEFGYTDDKCEEHKYVYSVNIVCGACADAQVTAKSKLADFGKTYIETMYTYEEAVKEASEHLEWDSGAQEMVDWIKNHK